MPHSLFIRDSKRRNQVEKVYLVLGASSDVGIEFINNMKSANETVTIVATYRNMSDELQKAIDQPGCLDIIPMQVDLSSKDDVEAFIGSMKELQIAPTHILHLAASKFEYMKLKSWDEKKVEESMQIGFFSFARICSEYLPVMAKNKYGKVVVMLSAYTLGNPPKFMSDYMAVKGALNGFMKATAAEYADKGLNINGISPNMMETKFLSNIDERIVEMSAEGTSKKRNISVTETVNGVMWLFSEGASYVNGINLNLSGGDYM